MYLNYLGNTRCTISDLWKMILSNVALGTVITINGEKLYFRDSWRLSSYKHLRVYLISLR